MILARVEEIRKQNYHILSNSLYSFCWTIHPSIMIIKKAIFNNNCKMVVQEKVSNNYIIQKQLNQQQCL